MAVAIQDTYRPVEVDLWGEKFETRDLPKGLQRKIDALGEEIRKIEEAAAEADRDLTDAEEEQRIGLVAQTFDVWLRRMPVEDEGESSSTKPSTLIKRKWKAEEISSESLLLFVFKLRQEVSGQQVESVGGTGRPT